MHRARKDKKTWQDHRTRQAKKEGYPARSVYKLSEMQEKWRILSPGNKVLDLGCSPGSWLLFAEKAVGPGGLVAGVDLTPVNLPEKSRARVLTGDVSDPDAAWFSEIGEAYDVVLSDMAPATTGNKATDVARSHALCEAALMVSDRVLSPGGTFVCKIFQGSGDQDFLNEVKKRFSRHRLFKPAGTRKQSREIYVIGFGKQEVKDVGS